MTQTQTLKDFNGRVIGYIETDSRTGNKLGRDFYRKVVGSYDKRLNLTKDFYGRIVGRGDLLSSLIADAERHYQEKAKRKKK